MITLKLKPEIEALVAERASAHGLTVEAYIQRVLERLGEGAAADSRERSHPAEKLFKTFPGTDAAPVLSPRITGEGSPPKDRSMEQAWLADHREQYAGQWVALDGDRLLGHGPTLKRVVDAAHSAGVKDALIARVESNGAPPYVGM